MPVAPQHQWLLGFRWRNKFYKETYLSFGLATAPFIFKLFGESLHWILALYLRWNLCHYLDDFIAVFNAKTTATQLFAEERAYIQATNLLGIPRNKKKDCCGTKVSVFGIEVDTSTFTARLSQDKLERAIKKTGEVLSDSSNSISYLDIQSLVGFLSFCSQAVHLGRVIMRRLWDFINHFPRSTSRTTRKRMLSWVREDME